MTWLTWIFFPHELRYLLLLFLLILALRRQMNPYKYEPGVGEGGVVWVCRHLLFGISFSHLASLHDWSCYLLFGIFQKWRPSTTALPVDTHQINYQPSTILYGTALYIIIDVDIFPLILSFWHIRSGLNGSGVRCLVSFLSFLGFGFGYFFFFPPFSLFSSLLDLIDGLDRLIVIEWPMTMNWMNFFFFFSLFTENEPWKWNDVMSLWQKSRCFFIFIPFFVRNKKSIHKHLIPK